MSASILKLLWLFGGESFGPYWLVLFSFCPHYHCLKKFLKTFGRTHVGFRGCRANYHGRMLRLGSDLCLPTSLTLLCPPRAAFRKDISISLKELE